MIPIEQIAAIFGGQTMEQPDMPQQQCYTLTKCVELRDIFAAVALHAYATKEPSKRGLNAQLAYAQADAMLKARGEGI